MDISKKKWETMYSEEEIASRVRELGKQIEEDYKDKNLMVVALLRGSFIFCADLIRNIDLPLRVNFMTTSSYGDSMETSGKVKVSSDVTVDIEGYDVLVVDDITDSATTMNFVLEHLKKKKPKSIKSCVLLDKPSRRKVELVPDYKGYEIDDKFVVGYGFDCGDVYRNVPYIFNVTDEDR